MGDFPRLVVWGLGGVRRVGCPPLTKSWNEHGSGLIFAHGPTFRGRFLQVLVKEGSRLKKGDMAYRHNQLDGIVILPTIKAPGQIDRGVDGGMEPRTAGALKAQPAIQLA